MVKSNKAPAHSQQSVKLRAKSLKGLVEISDFAGVSDELIAKDDNHARESLTSQSPEIMSTCELISTVGKIWGRASRSLAHYQPKSSLISAGNVSLKDSDSCYMVRNDNFGITNLIDRGYLHVDFNSSSYFSCIVQQSLTFIKATQGMHYAPCNDQFFEKLCWQSGHDDSIKHNNLLEEPNLSDIENLYSLTNRYGWMNQISIWPKPPIFLSNEVMKIVDAFTSKAAGNELSFSTGAGDLQMCNDVPNIKNLCPHGSNKVHYPQRASYTDNLIDGFQYKYSMALSVGLHPDGNMSTSTPDCIHEPNESNIEADHMVENEMRQCENLNTQDEVSGSCSSVTNKPHPLLANQEHAVSGALAGVFVSVCLHPLDTVKTIVQSCQSGQKSFCYIGQSVLSVRGIPGLYRGISSNITTSAPISAIYTFTYESVKGFLLPSLAKEYHSVAHCTAGASASIATSFVFTPSERIKQQMQVNSKYQNCWNAVQTIIEVGGLRSLYAGWGAVLCRNIPHSIIKFYTYESLKKMFISSQLPNKQPNTLQTLLCGGVAGSTAAVFSTPFDVVKTRLQTQMPGSKRRYHSILSALQDIREHEGFRGLYRGLIPRLAMYMSQGALFFASYEFFKTFLSLELHQQKSELTK